jgi:hydrogenase nickel incorporation protein HypA/HybF
MHEIGIANSILERVASDLSNHPAARPRRVGVRVGELAGIDPDALRFAFDALTLETRFAGMELVVEYCSARCRCRDCSREFEVRNFEPLCPACGSIHAQCIGGDQLEFAYLEVEDDESCSAGR